MADVDKSKSDTSRQATMEATAKAEFAELSEQCDASEPRFKKSVDEQDWIETVAVGSKYSKVAEEQIVLVWRSQSDARGCAASCKNRDKAGRASLTKTCISPWTARSLASARTQRAIVNPCQ
jgi:hypothetical protein